MKDIDTTSIDDIVLIDIDSIIIEDRSRDVDPDWAAALAVIFKTGEMLHPVSLWASERGPRLVAGAHRIAAHLINGEAQIAARWSKAATFAEAKILEITENIARRELSALDRAHHLSDLKDAYEEAHPEAKRGGDKQTAEAREKLTEIISFSSDAADKVGLSDRAIRMSVAMWKGLTDTTKLMARGTWLADHQAGLMQLSKVSPSIQAKAIALMFPIRGEPEACNVADALYILENGRVLNAVEKRFSGLNKTLKSLADEELDAVLAANEERIMQWVERRIGGQK